MKPRSRVPLFVSWILDIPGLAALNRGRPVFSFSGPCSARIRLPAWIRLRTDSLILAELRGQAAFVLALARFLFLRTGRARSQAGFGIFMGINLVRRGSLIERDTFSPGIPPRMGRSVFGEVCWFSVA